MAVAAGEVVGREREQDEGGGTTRVEEEEEVTAAVGRGGVRVEEELLTGVSAGVACFTATAAAYFLLALLYIVCLLCSVAVLIVRCSRLSHMTTRCARGEEKRRGEMRSAIVRYCTAARGVVYSRGGR